MGAQTEPYREIADRIGLILEDSSQNEVDHFAENGRRAASEAELDMRDKGFVYGFALALAQELGSEDKKEERHIAYDAAEEAWRRWTSPPTRRELREAS